MTGFQDDDDLPAFAKIMDIVVASESIPLLSVRLYRTVGINSHVAAYPIVPTNENSLILLSLLDNKKPLYKHSYIGGEVTCIKC